MGGRLDANGQPLVPHSDCPCGRPGQEVDHRDALVLAWTSGEPRRLLRAYSLDNLMWLCHDCHRAKTRPDLQQLAEMRAQQVCLAGATPVSQEQQHRCWMLIEGGVAPQQGLGLRRIPTTFSPQLVTCPPVHQRNGGAPGPAGRVGAGRGRDGSRTPRRAENQHRREDGGGR